MSKHNILIVTCALLLSNAMSGLDSTIINTALPAIIADLHGIELMGWIVAIFLLGTAVSTPLWSKLGEHLGNQVSYQIAALLFVLGSLLQGLAPNITFLILTRAIAGIGNGGMISLPYIIYANMYHDPRKRMRVLGFVSASYSTATIIGPLIGGWIVDMFSWHWIFFLNVPIGILSAVLVKIYYRGMTEVRKTSPIDYWGASLMTIGLVSLLTGIEMLGTGQPLIMWGSFAVAIICLTIMAHFEKGATDPIIPSRLFKNRALMIDFALFTIIWGAFIGFLIYTPMWAQGLLGTTALIGGATQIPSSLTNFWGSGSVAGMRKYFSPQKVIAIGIVTLMMAFVLLLVMGVKTPYWLILIAAAFEGFGNGACFNELQVKVQQDADLEDIPVATSFSFLIRMLSQTFMASIFGILMNHALKSGVAHSGGTITIAMMNQLSDATNVHSLPAHLIPAMRMILHHGLQNIMILSLGLMLLALLINLWAQSLEKRQSQTMI